MSYSNNGGGTLTLPSPTHVHHVDVSAAVRSLRRSMSRSPSKFSLVRTASSGSSSGSSTNEPGRQSPSRFVAQSPSPAQFNTPVQATSSFQQHLQQQQQQQHQQPTTSTTPSTSTTPFTSTFASTPFQPGVKLSVRSARPKPVASRPLSRTRASPKSPLKRVFGVAPDSGNPVALTSSPWEAPGQENNTLRDFALALSPSSRRGLEKPSRHSMHLDVSGASKQSLSKFLDLKSEIFPSAAVSPLKRTDAIMNPEQTSFGSPVAKRRSLHGISSLGNDFNVFDHPSSPPRSGFDIHEDGNQEYQLTSATTTAFGDSTTATSTAMPRRTSSLRKTTLQQRHGESRSSLGRRQGEKHLAQLSSRDPATPTASMRGRLSLEHYVAPDAPASPFSAQGNTPNLSLHTADVGQAPQPHQPHPLSRTLTQSSSSGSSFQDDSPTHIPIQLGERPRTKVNFSKSLPIGAQRPTRDPVATPRFKAAMTQQTAFMSTGLISKFNRNPERESPNSRAKFPSMPDTPCKKPLYSSNTYPPQFGGGRRQSRPSFDPPETPLTSRSSSRMHQGRRSAFGTSDQIGSIFKQGTQGRRTSLLSLDGDESAGNADADIPPTPTKTTLFGPVSSARRTFGTPNPSRNQQTPEGAFAFTFGAQPAASNCKYTSLAGPMDISGSQGDSQLLDAVKSPYDPATSSTDQGRQRHSPMSTPSPLKISMSTPLAHTPMNVSAKPRLYTLASPSEQVEAFSGSSPRTPQDSMGPPDATRFPMPLVFDGRVSVGQDASFARQPATPTARDRGSVPTFSERRAVTPVYTRPAAVADEGLLSRFDRAELLGRGEFSDVFRVMKYATPVSFAASLTTTPRRHTPQSPKVSAVYAVKKTRKPFLGVKDREVKEREVDALKSLTHSEHVVRFISSWEYESHLYIQTEYCEEGNLSVFLEKIGATGRLDDFRIWKIMLELCRGLKGIHDSGFVHLDLKPENVFVTHEGSLKIGDFGLAAKLPVSKGHDGEGDRRYIGPEILLGQYDKPADIYSLGLIILEIACNADLPSNGSPWVALREVGLKEMPSLTWTEAGSVVRDATGCPVEDDSILSSMEDSTLEARPRLLNSDRRGGFLATHDASNLFGTPKRTELQQAPVFMVDASHPSSLDSLVGSMIRKEPAARPTAQQLLDLDTMLWIAMCRRSGATVFEGNWGCGPPYQGFADTEMTDV